MRRSMSLPIDQTRFKKEEKRVGGFQNGWKRIGAPNIKLKGRYKRAKTGRGVDLAEWWNNQGIK